MPSNTTLINLSALNGTNGFTLNGIAIDDQSGVSVSSAGDINRDGIADFIIGAWQGDLNSGEAYVIYGTASGFSSTFDLSTLNGSNGFRIDGLVAGDLLGFSVSEAGDVNGDGFADIIVGAYGANPGSGGVTGISYVIFGQAAGFGPSFDITTLTGSNGFSINGVAADDISGFSVSSAGDVNGDGFDDLIIGAYGADPGGILFAGESYVVFGQGTAFLPSLNLAALSGSDGFRIAGVMADDRSGFSVASAGDVNGDGFDDVIIGALRADNSDINSGSSYVVFGKGTGFSPTFDLTTLNGLNGFRLDGKNANDSSGIAVASAGDVNGDGYGDIIIGAPFADDGININTGISYVVFGKSTPFNATMQLADIDGSNGFQILGINQDDRIGHAVASAGDVNGDGFDDLIIGARYADQSGIIQAGESYVVFGKASGFSETFLLSSLNGNNGFRLRGIAANDYSGKSVASAGDVNGDGFDDLIIGAHRADGGGDSNAGQSYVVFGQRSQTSVTIIGTSQGLIHNGGFGEDIIDAGDGDDKLKGWEGDDVLKGGSGDDSLEGGAGDDNGEGGAGNDGLFGGAGDDTLTGGSGIDGLFGGSDNDVLKGGSGGDTLNGEAGADVMEGGSGSDTYLTDGLDILVEQAGSGTDTVSSTASHVLGANFENLSLLLSGNLNGTGNTLLNFVTGNSGNNVLNGGVDGFADQLLGQLGNDTYVLGASTNDVVTDAGGIDTITSTISRSLAGFMDVENLTLLGAAATNGTGNSLANVIIGNTGLNVLVGGLGIDTLNGGGVGQDRFRLNALAESGDIIQNFDVNDFIQLKATAFLGLTAANKAANFVIRAADNLAQDAADRLVFRQSDDTLWYDSNGSGAGGLTKIADLSNNFNMTAADILIV